MSVPSPADTGLPESALRPIMVQPSGRLPLCLQILSTVSSVCFTALMGSLVIINYQTLVMVHDQQRKVERVVAIEERLRKGQVPERVEEIVARQRQILEILETTSGGPRREGAPPRTKGQGSPP